MQVNRKSLQFVELKAYILWIEIQLNWYDFTPRFLIKFKRANIRILFTFLQTIRDLIKEIT